MSSTARARYSEDTTSAQVSDRVRWCALTCVVFASGVLMLLVFGSASLRQARQSVTQAQWWFDPIIRSDWRQISYGCSVTYEIETRGRAASTQEQIGGAALTFSLDRLPWDPEPRQCPALASRVAAHATRFDSASSLRIRVSVFRIWMMQPVSLWHTVPLQSDGPVRSGVYVTWSHVAGMLCLSGALSIVIRFAAQCRARFRSLNGWACGDCGYELGAMSTTCPECGGGRNPGASQRRLERMSSMPQS